MIKDNEMKEKKHIREGAIMEVTKRRKTWKKKKENHRRKDKRMIKKKHEEFAMKRLIRIQNAKRDFRREVK